MSHFREICKRHKNGNWVEWGKENQINGLNDDRGALIQLIKNAQQEVQDELDSYAPDQHPDMLFLMGLDEILEGKS